jgi:hypothetical protein
MTRQAGSRFATSFDMSSARGKLCYVMDEFGFMIDELGLRDAGALTIPGRTVR